MVGMILIKQTHDPFHVHDVCIIHESYAFVYCVGRRQGDGSWSVLKGCDMLYAGYQPLFNFGNEDV